MSACQSISLSNTQTMLFDNDQKPEAIVLNFFFSVIGWLVENPKNKTKKKKQNTGVNIIKFSWLLVLFTQI